MVERAKDRAEKTLFVARAIGESSGDDSGRRRQPAPASLLGSPTDREAWWATVQGLTEGLGTTCQRNNSVETEMNRLETEYKE